MAEPDSTEYVLGSTAARLAALLRQRRIRIVLAESCTAGLAAATLARTPGISEFLCGSAVVYRDATKTAWLAVPQGLLDDPALGAVSAPVARAMAEGALQRTPEADAAASVTGHLGPHAPHGLDGVIYVAVVLRGFCSSGDEVATQAHRFVLPQDGSPDLRLQRQRAAARLLLQTLADALESAPRPAGVLNPDGL
jgi:PncC family amidohydrolase